MAIKSISTHLFALMLGMAVVTLWPRGERAVSNERTRANPLMDSCKSSTRKQQRQHLISGKFRQLLLAPQMNREITRSDLDSWIESMKDDPTAKGQALAIAGMMLDDPELIREGIALDPNNPHILFIGANALTFDTKERLELTKRLMEIDSDNALVAYMTVSQLMANGNQEQAMNIMKDVGGRSQMKDYGNLTQLLTEEAYIASGLSPHAASIRSTYDYALPYLIEMKSLAKCMISMHGSMTSEELAESRKLVATMGYRLSNQTKSKTLVNQLFGISLELSTLEGMPDDAPSVYHGLTIREARANILAEKESLVKAAEQFGDHQDRLMGDPDLMQQYIQRFRLTGEMEALQWLNRKLQAE